MGVINYKRLIVIDTHFFKFLKVVRFAIQTKVCQELSEMAFYVLAGWWENEPFIRITDLILRVDPIQHLLVLSIRVLFIKLQTGILHLSLLRIRLKQLSKLILATSPLSSLHLFFCSLSVLRVKLVLFMIDSFIFVAIKFLNVVDITGMG